MPDSFKATSIQLMLRLLGFYAVQHAQVSTAKSQKSSPLGNFCKPWSNDSAGELSGESVDQSARRKGPGCFRNARFDIASNWPLEFFLVKLDACILRNRDWGFEEINLL